MDLLSVLSGAGLFALGAVFGAFASNGWLTPRRNYTPVLYKKPQTMEKDLERIAEATLTNPFFTREEYVAGSKSLDPNLEKARLRSLEDVGVAGLFQKGVSKNGK